MSLLKSAIYTTVGNYSWTVPSGVHHVWVNMIAGSAGLTGSINDAGYGGSGAGEAAYNLPIAVTSGGTLTGSVGAGGAAGSWTFGPGLNATRTPATPGGNTTCGPFTVCGSVETANPITQEGGWGGGPTGQQGATGFNNWQGGAGYHPIKASPNHFGGSGGGGSGISNVPGYYGAGIGGFERGGAGGTSTASKGGGGGGAASVWGIGGAGGNASRGSGNVATNYGAGSGASADGSFGSASAGIAGFSGRVEIFYVEP